MKTGDKVEMLTHWVTADRWEWLPYVWTIVDIIPANLDRGELFAVENERGDRRERPRSWLRPVRNREAA